MLCRDSMPRSHDAALEQGECRFYGVCVNVAANINALSMLNRFMFGVMHSSPFHGEGIGHEFIRHNHVYIVADVFLDVLGECASLYILRMEESKFAAAL